jgi:hypothetical protein
VPGEMGDPARQAGERAGSWRQTVEEVRRYKMSEGIGGGLITTPSHVNAQSMYHICILCINPLFFMNHDTSHVLLFLSVSGK